MTELHTFQVDGDKSFSKRTLFSLSCDERKVLTIFKDDEAIRVYQGIQNLPSVRAILSRHFQGKASKHDIFEAHNHAMKVFDKYGIEEIDATEYSQAKDLFRWVTGLTAPEVLSYPGVLLSQSARFNQRRR